MNTIFWQLFLQSRRVCLFSFYTAKISITARGGGEGCGNGKHVRPGLHNTKLGNNVEYPGSVNSQSVYLVEQGGKIFFSVT